MLKKYHKAVALLVVAVMVIGAIPAFADYTKKEDIASFNREMKKAQRGDLEAQTRVGFYYENGMGVKQNYAEALRWKL